MSGAVDDRWQTDAAHRLRQHVMRAPLGGRDYAPDTSYEQLKRGHAGPRSVEIGRILQCWADMWAQDMREFPDGDANAQWETNMCAADAEIDRYLAGHTLGNGAAA